MQKIDFYYDFRSPYSYFASIRMDLLASKGAKIIWRPVSVDVLLNLQARQKPWSEITDPLCPPKRDHFMADIFRLIEYWKIPFKMPAPVKPECNKAMAISALLEQEGTNHSAFHDSVHRAVWQEQQDGGDVEVLKACLNAGGHDLSLLDRAETEGKKLLTQNTLASYDRGVFGVPSFVHDEQLYFGADRMELLASRL